MGRLLMTVACLSLFFATPLAAEPQNGQSTEAKPLTLITATPDEGFELALRLARRAVTSTQTDKEMLHFGRQKYSRDARFRSGRRSRCAPFEPVCARGGRRRPG